MLDRFARRLVIWSVLTTLPAVAAAATVTGLAPSGLVTLAPVLSAIGLFVSIVGWRFLQREVQGRLREGKALAEQARRLHEAMHASADGLYLLRAVRDECGQLADLEVTDVNGTGAGLLHRPTATLIGQRLRRDIGGALGEHLFDRYRWAMSTGSPILEETRVDRRVIDAGWIRHQAVPTSDGLAVTARDITTQKREEKALRRASVTDDLTGLYNRRGFMAIAEQQLRLARRSGSQTVVMYADMDGFKELNDTFGHAVGDRALRLVGRLLRDTVRDCDLVARLGGDEFTILACDADSVGARVIQRRIEDRLAIVNASGELPARLQLTIGYTRVRPTDDAGVAELLARADQLLYARKRRRHLTRLHGGAVEAPAVRRAPKARTSVRPSPLPESPAALRLAVTG